MEVSPGLCATTLSASNVCNYGQTNDVNAFKQIAVSGGKRTISRFRSWSYGSICPGLYNAYQDTVDPTVRYWSDSGQTTTPCIYLAINGISQSGTCSYETSGQKLECACAVTGIPFPWINDITLTSTQQTSALNAYLSTSNDVGVYLKSAYYHVVSGQSGSASDPNIWNAIWRMNVIQIQLTYASGCGNGILETGESCDNGNNAGCTNCQFAPGYSCTSGSVLTGVTITGTAGQFSCASTSLAVGMTVAISGTLGGTGTISGYTNPRTYFIIATNGSTTFTLSSSSSGSGVTTTTGTPTGLTYTPTAICYLCSDGQYGSGGICRSCPTNSVSASDFSKCVCSTGYYMDYTTTCIPVNGDGKLRGSERCDTGYGVRDIVSMDSVDWSASYMYCVSMISSTWTATIRGSTCRNYGAVSGFTISSQYQINNWNDAFRSYWTGWSTTSNAWQTTTIGSTSYTATELSDFWNLVRNVKWSANPSTVDVTMTVTTGSSYKLVTFFQEACCDRKMNVYVDGNEVVFDRRTGPVYQTSGSAQMLEYYFTAISTSVSVRFTPSTGIGAPVSNAMVNAILLKSVSSISQYAGCTADSKVMPGYYCSNTNTDTASVCTFFHFAFGPTASDGDAGTSSSARAVTLPVSTRFFGVSHTTLYIMNNGVLSWGQSWESWQTTTQFSTYSGVPIIAALFSDWNFPCTFTYSPSSYMAHIYYRFGSSSEITDATARVRNLYGVSGFTASYVLIVTYYGDKESCDKVDFNYVQVAVVASSLRTYVLWLFSDDSIRWNYPTGAPSNLLPLVGVHDGIGFQRPILLSSEDRLVASSATGYTKGLYILRVDAFATPMEPVSSVSTESKAQTITFSGAEWKAPNSIYISSPAVTFSSTTFDYDVWVVKTTSSTVAGIPVDLNARIFVDNIELYSNSPSASYPTCTSCTWGTNWQLTSVAITGTSGQFSCASGSGLAVGQAVTITGTIGGSGSISGYTSGAIYYIITTNGSTTFTLSTTATGSGVTTTTGTPSGLTYSRTVIVTVLAADNLTQSQYKLTPRFVPSGNRALSTIAYSLTSACSGSNLSSFATCIAGVMASADYAACVSPSTGYLPLCMAGTNTATNCPQMCFSGGTNGGACYRTFKASYDCMNLYSCLPIDAGSSSCSAIIGYEAQYRTLDSYCAGLPAASYTARNNVEHFSAIRDPSAALSSVVITGTAGQFSCASTILNKGQAVTITGTFSGSGSISGYTSGAIYYIITTNGSTTFTLSTTATGSGVTTTTGTPSGLTYSTPLKWGNTCSSSFTIDYSTRSLYTLPVSVSARTITLTATTSDSIASVACIGSCNGNNTPATRTVTISGLPITYGQAATTSYSFLVTAESTETATYVFTTSMSLSTDTTFSSTASPLSALSSVVITGTGGQFSCTSTRFLDVGSTITITGTYGGTGSISGYASGTVYTISQSNRASTSSGATTFTLTNAGAALVTTAGTPTGLVFSFPVSDLVLLFRQTVPQYGNRNYWISGLNVQEPSNPNYSVLNTVSNFRGSDGKYQFKIIWPLQTAPNTQEWKQTSNPFDSAVNTGGVSGYSAVSIYFTSNSWGGLEMDTGGSAAADGSVNSGNWYYAIGSAAAWNGGIPGASATVTVTEMYIQDFCDVVYDNLQATMTLTINTNSYNGQISYNSGSYTPRTYSFNNQALPIGKSIFEMALKATDTSIVGNYAYCVNRVPSPVYTMASPPRVDEVTTLNTVTSTGSSPSYAVTVESFWNSLTITSFKTDSVSTVSYYDSSSVLLRTGDTSSAITLNPDWGASSITITIRVTSQSGLYTSYSLTISKSAAPLVTFSSGCATYSTSIVGGTNFQRKYFGLQIPSNSDYLWVTGTSTSPTNKPPYMYIYQGSGASPVLLAETTSDYFTSSSVYSTLTLGFPDIRTYYVGFLANPWYTSSTVMSFSVCYGNALTLTDSTTSSTQTLAQYSWGFYAASLTNYYLNSYQMSITPTNFPTSAPAYLQTWGFNAGPNRGYAATNWRSIATVGTSGNSPIGGVYLNYCVVSANPASTRVLYAVHPTNSPAGTLQFLARVQATTPTISSINPTSGNTAGGTTLTLFGSNFEVNRNTYAITGSVTVGGQTCTSPVYSSGNIVCSSPAGQGTATTVLTLYSQASASFSGYIYSPPTITSISASVALITDGNYFLTITGTNFGTTATVTIGSASCSSPTVSNGGTRIVCTVPAGSGSRTLTVTVSSQTDTFPFIYAAPLLSSLTTTSYSTAGGSVLTIAGTSFGDSAASVSVSLGQPSGTVSCPLASSPARTHSLVYCNLPAGLGASNQVILTVTSLVSNSLYFSYSAPTVSSFNPSTLPAAQTTVTITGTNLGVNSFSALSSVQITGTAGQFSCASSTLTVGMTVTLSGTLGGSGTISGYTSPKVYFIVATNGSTTFTLSTTSSGSGVTTTAGTPSGLTYTPSASVVTLVGGGCTITSQGHTSIVCNLPSRASTSITSGTVAIGNQQVSVSLGYVAPAVSSINPTTVPTAGGTITVTGTNFWGPNPTVIWNGAALSAPSASSDTSLTVIVPASVGSSHSLQVSVGGYTSSILTVSSSSATISGITYSSAGPDNLPRTDGSTTATIAGTNFGSSSTPGTVSVGGVNFAISSWSETSIVCTFGVGAGTVTLTVSNAGLTATTSVTYSAPVISSVIPTAVSTAGGVITITGYNFFTTTGTVTLNSASTAVVSWSQTQIVTTVSAGRGVNLNLVVTQSSRTGTFSYSFAAPAITSITASSFPTAGNVPVTIAGTSFDTTGTVSVADNSASIVSWSHDRVVFTLPIGFNTAQTVSLTTTGSQSTTSTLSYNVPAISSVTPSNYGAAGVTITVAGSNFGASSANIQLSIDGATCSGCLVSVSHTQVVFTTWTYPVTTSPSLVIQCGTQISAAFALGVAAPVINSISPGSGVTGPAGSVTLTVNGSNFGVGTLTTTVRVGSSICSNLVYSSGTRITCDLPVGLDSQVVSVTVGDMTGVGASLFQYQIPAITSLSTQGNAELFTVGGTTLIIDGTSFGASPGVVRVNNVIISTASWSHTQITLSMPAGSGTVPITVQAGNQFSLPVNQAYAVPVISSVSGSGTTNTDGTVPITLAGRNFGTVANNALVSISGRTCTISAITDGSITCRPTASAGANLAVVVTVSGLISTDSTTWSFAAPVISSIPSNSGNNQYPAVGGVIITLTGSNFGPSAAAPVSGVVTVVGGSSDVTLTLVSGGWSHTAIQVYLSAGQGTRNFRVTSAGVTSNSQPFTYNAPRLTSVSPTHGPTEGWTSASLALLTIFGTDFSTSSLCSDSGGSPCVTVSVEGNNCVLESHANSQIIVRLPSAVASTVNGGPVPIIVTIEGQVTPSYPDFTWDEPVVTCVSSSSSTISAYNAAPSTYTCADSSAPTNSGLGTNAATTLTIVGRNFGSSSAAPTVVSGSNSCTGGSACMTSRTHTQIVLTNVPVGVGLNQAVRVTTQGGVTSITGSRTQFSYAAPAITGASGCDCTGTSSCINPSEGLVNCVTGGTSGSSTQITLFGTNFGAASDITLTRDYGTSSSASLTVVSVNTERTQIVASYPAGNGADHSISIAVGGQTATAPFTFSYRVPLFDSASLQLSSSSSGEASLTTSSIYDTRQYQFTGRFFKETAGTGGTNPTVTYGPTGTEYQAVVLFGTTDTLVLFTLAQPTAGASMFFQVTNIEANPATISRLSTFTISTPVPVMTAGTLAISRPLGSPNGNPSHIIGTTSAGNYVLFSVSNIGNTADFITIRYGYWNLTESPVFDDLSADFPETCTQPVVITPVTSLTANYESVIECKIGSGAGGDYRFVALVNTAQAVAPSDDYYDYPQIPKVKSVALASGQTECTVGPSSGCTSNCYITDCPTTGGVRIEITGRYFSTSINSITVYVNGATCTDIQEVDLSTDARNMKISCLLPVGAGLRDSVNLVVSSAGFLSLAYNNFIGYAGPLMTSITGCVDSGRTTNDCPRDGNNVLTITGSNFGSANALVLVAGGVCSQVSINPSQTEINCFSPYGISRFASVVVLQSGGIISSSTSVPANAPTTSLSLFSEAPGNRGFNVAVFDGDRLISLDVYDTASSSAAADSMAASLNLLSIGLYVAIGANGDASVYLSDSLWTAMQNQLGASTRPTSGASYAIISKVGGNSGERTEQISTSAAVTATISFTTSCSTVQVSVGSSGSVVSNPRVEMIATAVVTPCGSLNIAYVQCQPGYYESSPTDYSCTSCPPGAYTNAPSAQVCLICPAGKYSDSAASVCIDCASGRFSVRISNSQGADGCTDCPAGTYSEVVSQSSCTDCAAGTYATNGAVSTCEECVAGKYAASTASISCDNCAQGRFSLTSGQFSCAACEIGTYASSTMSTICLACEPGRAQAQSGQATCNDCANGQAQTAAGQAVCLECDEGYYSGALGNSVCDVCNAGQFSVKDNQNRGATICSECAVGTYSNAQAQAVCIACAPGYYASSESTISCTVCDPGTYSGQGAASCSPCAAGYITSSPAAFACDACSRGRYAANTGLSVCDLCAAGRYGSNVGLVGCTDCPQGSVAVTAGQVACADCQPGFYMSNSASAVPCVACDPGFYQANPASNICSTCDAGYITSSSGQASCTSCDVGYFAAATGLSTCSACALGEYTTLSSANIDCEPCPAGSIASSVGTAVCTLCTRGSYSTGTGNFVCTACEAGRFQGSDGQDTCIDCASGTFTAVIGQPVCLDCVIGKIVMDPGRTECEDCSMGRSQPLSGQTFCVDCALGRATAVSGQATCDACDAGKFAMFVGQAICNACDAGQFCGSAGCVTCSDCAPGTITATQGGLVCTDCSVGTYRPEVGGVSCADCTPGSYAPSTGLSSCTDCPAGRFQSASGQGVCELCPIGSIAASSGANACTQCAPGTIAAIPGSSSCSNCPSGQFSVTSGSGVCTNCPAGSIASVSGSAVCTLCDPGYVQPAPGQSACVDCLPGSSSDAYGALTCVDCLPGRFQANSLATSCDTCRAGYICSAGATVEQECPAGYFGSAAGQTLCTACAPGSFTSSTATIACTPCSAGNYAFDEASLSCASCATGTFAFSAAASMCEICAPGQFAANTGSTSCTVCDPGRAQSLSGQAACINCEAGTYAPVTGLLACLNCNVGFYNAAGESTSCLACNLGTVQPSAGQTSCVDCALGKYMDSVGQAVCLECLGGYYADTPALANCVRCNAGSFSALSNGLGPSSCTNCAVGRYALSSGQVLCFDCPLGKYTGSSGTISCTACAEGTFSGQVGTTSCVDCQVGRYSAVQDSYVCLDCLAGRFARSTGMSDCVDCSIGRAVSLPGQELCGDCESGTFTGVTRSVYCERCLPGQYTANSGSTICLTCSPGTYQPGVASTGCLDCAIGDYQTASAQVACLSCDPGRYTNRPAQVACEQCNVGTAQPYSGSTICVDCEAGRSNNAFSQLVCPVCVPGTYADLTGMTSCTNCPVGTSQDGFGSPSCIDCVVGKYQLITGTTGCLDCAAGRYTDSPAWSLDCLLCSLGQVQFSAGRSFCEDCEAGRSVGYLGGVQCTACSPGFFSLQGASACLACVAGEYQENQQQSRCNACEPGFFSAYERATACVECTAGTFSAVQLSSVCTDCIAGTSQGFAGRSSCNICQAGKYTPVSAETYCWDCAIGFSSTEPGMTECPVCVSGTFSSSAGSSSCTLCSAGQFQALSGMSSCAFCSPGRVSAVAGSSDCTPCLAGLYSNSNTGSAPTSCMSCLAGKYSQEASNDCYFCNPGSFSLMEASDCISCDPGYYQRNPGASLCIQCPAGRYSESRGSSDCLACDAGKYANETASSFCFTCQVGEYQGATAQESCLQCEVGTFQDSRAAEVCLSCPVGKFADQTGMSNCDNCAAGKFQNVQNQAECLECVAGTFSQEGAALCSTCPAGRFMNETGQSVCFGCPAGSYTDDTNYAVSHEECQPCELGTFAKDPASPICLACGSGRYGGVQGLTVCFDCLAGRYATGPLFDQPTGWTTCLDCSAGYYNPAIGQGECLSCDRGRYAHNESSIECIDCDSGRYAYQYRSVDCSDCESGYFQDGFGQSTCKSCQLGRFMNDTGATACSFCAPGTFTDAERLAECFACAAGKHGETGASVGSSTCVNCEPGTYQDLLGSTSCPNCDAGSYQSLDGQTTCNLCIGGFFSTPGSPMCLQCAPGTISNTLGAERCFTCDQNSVTNDDQTQCLCDIGYAAIYSVSSNSTLADIGILTTVDCQECPEGAVCDYVGVEWDTMQAATGFWQGTDGTYYRCLLASQCVGGDACSVDPITGLQVCDSQCAQFRTGALCAQCLPDYSESSVDGSCQPCQVGATAYTWTAIAILIGIVIMLCVYYFVLWSSSALLDAADIEDRLASNANQSLDAKEEGIFKQLRYGRYLNIEGPPPPKPDAQYKLKILLTFLQILTNIGLSLQIDYPQAFLTFVNYFNPANLDFIQFTDADCISTQVDYFFEMFVWLLTPVFLVVVLTLFFVLPHAIQRNITPRDRKRRRREFWRLVYFSLFLVYPAVSSSIFGVFICKDVDFNGLQSYLVADFGILCSGERYEEVLKWALAAVFVYPLGIPLFFLKDLWLYRYSKPEEASEARMKKDVKLKNAYESFKAAQEKLLTKAQAEEAGSKVDVGRQDIIEPFAHCMQLADLYRTAPLGLRQLDQAIKWYDVVVKKYAASNQTHHVAQAAKEWCLREKKVFMSGRINRLGEKGVRAQLGFLYDCYEGHLWFYELIDMLHKLFATCLIGFLPWSVQLRLGTAILCSYLIILLWLNPYIRKGDDALHLVAQIELVLLLTAGACFESAEKVDAGLDAVLSVVLICMVGGFSVWWCGSVWSVLKKMLQESEAPCSIRCRKCLRVKAEVKIRKVRVKNGIVGDDFELDRKEKEIRMKADLARMGEFQSTAQTESI